MGTLGPKGELDPAKGIVVSCFGKKRSGKSIMAKLFFSSYPFDRLIIDTAADDGPFQGVIDLEGDVSTLPKRWPEHLREDNQRMTLRYLPDPASPTYLQDMDAVMGLAMHHGKMCVLIHEVGEIAPSGKVPPHMRRVLQFGRHRKLTLIFCNPRPIGVDKKVIGQSDLVYTFNVPDPDDRQYIAKNIGWDYKEFDAEWRTLKAHEYLRHDTNIDPPETETETDLRLVHCPALPLEVVQQMEKL